MTQQCVSHTAPTLTVLVKKTHLANVWFGHILYIYRLPGTFYVPLGFGVVLIGKVCFFVTSTVLQSGRFYTGFIVPKL